MSSVLVLNQSYAPINIQDVRKAIKKVYCEKCHSISCFHERKAEVLETYVGKHLNTFKDAMDAPAVIRLLHFASIPHKGVRNMPFTRKNIWLRDNGICQYCGKFVAFDDLSWDHVFPQKRGGQGGWLNIVTCCFDCNNKKDCRTPEEAGMKLRRKPFIPKYTLSKEKAMMLKLKSFKNFPHESWKKWIYWNIELEE